MKKSLLIGVLMLGAVGSAAVAEAQFRPSAWKLHCSGQATAEARVVVTFEDDTRKVITNACLPGTIALEPWPGIPSARGTIAGVKATLTVTNGEEENRCVYTTELPFADEVRCKAELFTGDQAELFFSIQPGP